LNSLAFGRNPNTIGSYDHSDVPEQQQHEKLRNVLQGLQQGMQHVSHQTPGILQIRHLGPPPQNVTPIEQRTKMAMDAMDFPPSLPNNVRIPQYIPSEIKNWGPLKQWAQNTALEYFELINRLQTAHYQ
jgi:hypothetical protein